MSVDVACLREKTDATRPEIELILISNSKSLNKDIFERELYVIRRQIEKAAGKFGVSQLYIASLIFRLIIYKAMMLVEQIVVFYPDLMDPRFKSAFAIYHQL